MKQSHWLIALTGVLIIAGMCWYAQGKQAQFQRTCEAAGNHIKKDKGMTHCVDPKGRIVESKDW